MSDIVSSEIYGMLLLSLRRSTFFRVCVRFDLWNHTNTYYTYIFIFVRWMFINIFTTGIAIAFFVFSFHFFSLEIILHIRKNIYIFPVFFW